MRIQGLVSAAALASLLFIGGVQAQAPETVVETEEQRVERERKVRELQRRVRQDLSRQRFNEALRGTKDLVILEPYEEDYHLTLGLLYRQLNQQSEARRKFQDYLDLDGSPSVAFLMIADSYAAAGDRANAFIHLRKAAENGMNIMRAVQQFPSMQEYRADTDFIKLALQLERYELNLNQEFQDIFSGRFKTVEEVDDEPDDELAEAWDRARQELELKKLKVHLANIEHYLSSGNEDNAMRSYSLLLELLDQQSKFTVPAFAAEIRRILARKDDIERGIEEIRLKYFYEKSREVIAELERLFRSEDYPAVEERYSEVIDLANKIEQINPEFEKIGEQVREVGQYWVRRAKVRREFNSKDLDIQGIILHEGPAIAIVNETVIEEGGYFDGMNVVAIEPNQIIFRYKEEEVPLVFRRY